MIPLAIIILWAGYGIGSWGYLLVKGHDVTLREWFSPLHPYSGSWPPPPIPATQVFPGLQAAGTTGQSPPGGGNPPPRNPPPGAGGPPPFRHPGG